MPKKPFDQLSEKQRTAIFKTCCELFAQNGYSHTSVKMITKRLRVADGYLYYYFNGKRDLAKYVIATGNEMWQMHYRNHVEEKNPGDLFDLFKLCVLQMIRFIKEHREVFGAYFKLINEPNFPLAEWLVDQIGWIDQIYRKSIREGIEQGVIRSDIPENIIVMALDVVNTRLQEFYYNPNLDPVGVSGMEDAPLEEFLNLIVSLLRNGMARNGIPAR